MSEVKSVNDLDNECCNIFTSRRLNNICSPQKTNVNIVPEVSLELGLQKHVHVLREQRSDMSQSDANELMKREMSETKEQL